MYDVDISDDGKSFYLTTSEKSPFEHHFYRMPVNGGAGGAREMITSMVGEHSAEVSPDEQDDRRRVLEREPSARDVRHEVRRRRSGIAAHDVAPPAQWLSLKWLKPEIVWIPASDGVKVPARIYRPKDMGAKPNGAAVLFVHGAGYLHNVHNWWSSYSREYMFNQYLAIEGLRRARHRLSRARAGYGRDWRIAIYRYMGGRDLQDEVDGVEVSARRTSAFHRNASACTAAATAAS